MGKDDSDCTLLAETKPVFADELEESQASENVSDAEAKQVFIDEAIKWYLIAKYKTIPDGVNMDAEDFCQEAFLNVWTHICKTGELIKNPFAYLSAVRQNKIWNALTHKSKEIPFSQIKARIPSTSDSDEDSTEIDIISDLALQKYKSEQEETKTRDRLDEILELVPADIKEMFTRYLNDETWDEIGKTDGISGNAANKKVHRSLTKLLNKSLVK